jgi:hypothetical protein
MILCDCIGPTNRVNEMTPDELIKVLKRYLRESNQGERMLAARIGVNQSHPSSLAQSLVKGKLVVAACFLRRVEYL